MFKHVLESSGARVTRITQQEPSPATLKIRNRGAKKSSSYFAGISDHLRSDNDMYMQGSGTFLSILQRLNFDSDLNSLHLTKIFEISRNLENS